MNRDECFGNITAAESTPSILDAYIAGLGPSECFAISGSYPLQWTGQPGRLYSIYAATNLKSPFVFQAYVPWHQAEYIDLIHTNEPTMFYRVGVELDN